MPKRTHKEVRKTILTVLSDGYYHSFGNLERKCNTNWQTIRDHCQYLTLFGAVTITDEGVKITKEGLNILKKL